MKLPKTMVLTVEELEAIRDEAAESARREGFSPEEMKAIREQYEQRLEEESKKREDLEWRLRLAIARLGDVESATDKLRAIQDSLKGVLTEVVEEEDEEQTQPRILPGGGRRVSPPGVPARALRTTKRAIA